MQTQLMIAITVACLVGGCTYDPPLADAIPQPSNDCLESASQFGPSCTGDKWLAERDERAAQYYANLRPSQPSSATALAPPTQPPS